DNADLRLTETSFRLGLASQERMERVLQKKTEVEAIKSHISKTAIDPLEINSYFKEIASSLITEKQKLDKIILRPGVGLMDIMMSVPTVHDALSAFSSESLEQAEIQTKYQVYIDKEKDLVERMYQLENLEIPELFDYQRIISLGAEAREKLNRVKPRTLGQASRISGINPSDVQILMVYMGR
ncbi:MAG: tRNA uridine-5-carboxymethylaminomethyl(34) synthesis enzyme MnmG, partial [Flavisolibacter sp.]